MDTEKVSLACAAYAQRLRDGWNKEESLRNTRQEFDLSDVEESRMLIYYADAASWDAASW